MPVERDTIDENAVDTERIILRADDVVRQYNQYDDVITAVNRVNLRVHEGEFVAIIGPSGSGKSTLLQLLAGLDTPQAGHIYIRNQEITAMDQETLAEFRGNYIGMVFQNHNLIPQFTALENILVPTMMCSKPDSSYQETLKQLIVGLGIADRLNHLPGELSGGQRQRVAIARALINMPHVVFADEPTGNLDAKNAEEVLNLFLKMRIAMNQTLVMVTHDMSIASKADRIFEMKNGRLDVYRPATK